MSTKKDLEAEIIYNSKTTKVLKAYYINSNRTAYIALNSLKQYNWEQKRYQWAIYNISLKEFKKLLSLLCESFNIKTPRIKVFKKGYIHRRATALVVDNMLLISDKNMLQPLICVHEFVHFYLWDKYKCIESHNSGKMKSMVSSIMKTIRPKYDIL